MRFYLDEDQHGDLAGLLTARGHEAVYAPAVGRSRLPDADHFQYAAADGLTLVTFNREDFRDLHRYWTALYHWGVISRPHAGVLTAFGQIEVREWSGLLHQFAQEYQEVGNQLYYWLPRERRWAARDW